MVVVVWIVVLLGLGGLNRVLGGNPPSSYLLSGTDSAAAQELLGQAFPGSAADASPILLHNDALDFGAEPGANQVNAVSGALRDNPSVTVVTTPTDVPGQLSSDHHTAMINVTVNERDAAKVEVGQELLAAAEKQTEGTDTEVALGGFLGRQVSSPSTHESEILGLLAAVLVLFFTLRRFLATIIPLANAILAVGIGLSIVHLLNRIVFIPDVAPTLGTMLGLGVGIDYALFLVTRHRQLLRRGFSVPDAVGRTSGTAGAGMIFAGCTLIAAVCGLALTGLSFLAWLGYAAAIVVAVAVTASVTFVPAMLGLSGRRVMRKADREADTGDSGELDRTRWAKLANAVTARPWLFAVGSTLVLLLMAAPTLTLTLGHTDASILPKDTTARQAYDLTSEAFGPGATAPLAIVTSMYAPAQAPAADNPDAPATTNADSSGGDPRTKDPRLVGLREALLSTPGIVAADPAVVSTDGGVSIIRVTPEWSGADPRTEELVKHLRAQVLPEAEAGQGMSAHVGGVTAATTDLSELIAQRTPWFILGVVSLSFVLLMVAYRSLLIPIKAALMNLISIAAAYGVVTAVFQWGWGAQVIGLEGPIPIESYVPMMMFAVLFGLSMDYEVFLLTAFREHWERTGDMTVSVRRGLADTGKVVTSAALIMCVVFGSFVLSDNAIVKMFGIGLATAVFVDATIVRCLLVPAIMVLAQKGTWWLPGWLDRLLPQMHVEGDPAALDAVAIMAESSEPRGRRGPRAPALWAAGGVAAACASAFVIAGPDAALLPAAALSAVCGGLIAVLPLRRRDADWGALPRALSFIAGAALMALVAGVVSAAGAPDRTNGWLLAWSVAITGVLILVAGARSIWIPAAFGGIALVVARMAVVPDAVAALSGQGVGVSQVLSAALLPGLLALLVATVGGTFSADRRRGQPAEGSAAPVVRSEDIAKSAEIRPAVGAASTRLSTVGLAEAPPEVERREGTDSEPVVTSRPQPGPPPMGDPYQRFRPPPGDSGADSGDDSGAASGEGRS